MPTAIPFVPPPSYLPDAPSAAPPQLPNNPPDTPEVDYGYQVLSFPPPDPESPLVNQEYPYLQYALTETITGDPGYAATPVGGPAGTPQDITRVHSGSARKVVAFAAMRYGQPPAVPSRAPSCPNDVEAPWTISRALVGFLLDGTPLYSVVGAYSYFLQATPQESDPVNLAALPFTSLTPSQQQMTEEIFSDEIYQGVQPAGAPANVIGF